MIPRAHITAWRRHTPWLTDAQVEQDLILSRALVEIFAAPALSSQLAFRGGTALHKLHLSPPSRYSDLGVALTGSPEPDAEKIMRCFLRYMDSVDAAVSRAEFEANLAGKLTDSGFLADTGPLLAPRSSQFDPFAAAQVVMTRLIARLPGEPWKGNR